MRLTISFLTVSLLFTADAFADEITTQSFANAGLTLADGSTTGDIDTATVFTIGAFTSTPDDSGALAGMPTETFVPFTFSTTSPTSLTFGNSVFGMFTSTSITDAPAMTGFRDLNVMGNWTPGTFGGVTGGPLAAELEVTLSQTPATNGTVSANGAFAVLTTVTSVPEPSTIFLVALGLAATMAGSRLRRRDVG